MTILTVDLASKFSAVSVQDEAGQVLGEFDSANKSSLQFVEEIATAADHFDARAVLVEDVPYGISKQFMVKPALRLQGLLMFPLAKVNKLGVTWFINPSTWMGSYGIKTRGQSDQERTEILRSAAAHLGYTAPDLVGDYLKSLPEGTKVLKKHTNPLNKSRTDYVAAYLIGHWLRQTPDFASHTGVQAPSI